MRTLVLLAIIALAPGLHAQGIQLGSNTGSEVPSAEDAIKVEAIADGQDALLLRFLIAPNVYLYKDKLRFRLANDDASLGRYALPEGTWTTDEFNGKSEVYRNTVELRLPIVGFATLKSAELDVAFQGCADAGVCYPPTQQRLSVEFQESTDAS